MCPRRRLFRWANFRFAADSPGTPKIDCATLTTMLAGRDVWEKIQLEMQYPPKPSFASATQKNGRINNNGEFSRHFMPASVMITTGTKYAGNPTGHRCGDLFHGLLFTHHG